MATMGLRMVVVVLKGCEVIRLPHAKSLGVENHPERDRGYGRAYQVSRPRQAQTNARELNMMLHSPWGHPHCV